MARWRMCSTHTCNVCAEMPCKCDATQRANGIAREREGNTNRARCFLFFAEEEVKRMFIKYELYAKQMVEREKMCMKSYILQLAGVAHNQR